MYRQILVPVDLAHAEQLKKALDVAADLAGHYDAGITLVGVTAAAPSAVAHNPAEFAQKLEDFAAAEGEKRSASFAAMTKISHDPAVDVDTHLQAAADEIGADLVIMASHVPGFADFIFASRAGYLASHSALSVFVVR